MNESDNIMKRIAQFEKVTQEQFIKDFMENFVGTEKEASLAYNNVEIPRRSTKGSAGYDFKTPADFELKPNDSIKIPTGIRAKLDDGWVLKIYPRSGLGFKYRLQLDNTVGIIDSDYYYSDNQGHIMIKITNDGKENKTIKLNAGKAFAQGVFVEYGLTFDDDVSDLRNGGFGSTDK